jgi:crossover junction endodeoxyribonuclease RusA
MIELILPYPPTVNHYKKVGATIKTKNGKDFQLRVTCPKTRVFYYEVWVKIRSLKATGRIVEPIVTRLCLTLLLYPPDKRKRDIDNVLKPTVDSLVKGGLIADDVQIDRLVIERCGIISQGQVIVRIEELT